VDEFDVYLEGTWHFGAQIFANSEEEAIEKAFQEI
jgi:hypothetical protein